MTDGQVGWLFELIRAEASRLEGLIPFAPPPLRELAEATLAQQIPLLDQNFLNIISSNDKSSLVSARRSEWIVWAQNQVSTLKNLISAIQGGGGF